MTATTLKLSDLAGPDADGWSDVAVFVRADGSESEPFVVGTAKMTAGAEVVEVGMSDCLVVDVDGYKPVSGLPGKWSGPIPQPQEPPHAAR